MIGYHDVRKFPGIPIQVFRETGNRKTPNFPSLRLGLKPYVRLLLRFVYLVDII